MKTTLFEDTAGDEFAVTTHPDLRVVELEILTEGTSIVELGAEVAPKVASLILSTFGEDVGVEFHPCGRTVVHSGAGDNRVEVTVPETAQAREDLLNLAIASMGAINAYDAEARRIEEEVAQMEAWQRSLEDLVDGIFGKVEAKATADEDAEELDREALALHNAYYGDDLSEPWTLEQLKEDDPYDLECFRRAAQAARAAYRKTVVPMI